MLHLLLIRSGIVSRHALHQRSGTTAIQETHGNARASAIVRRGKSTIEVRGKVDICAVVGSWGKDTSDADADVGFRVCGR